jgi:hypothetical protein
MNKLLMALEGCHDGANRDALIQVTGIPAADLDFALADGLVRIERRSFGTRVQRITVDRFHLTERGLDWLVGHSSDRRPPCRLQSR